MPKKACDEGGFGAGMTVILPIEPERLRARSWTDRFLGHDPRRNYFVRAKNVVLTGHLDPVAIEVIRREFVDGDLIGDFAYEWGELLEEITYFIAIDGLVDGEERAFFSAYVSVFAISQDRAAWIYRRGARRAYMDILLGFVSDEVLSRDEVARLERIARRFGLTHHEQHGLIRDTLESLLRDRMDEILADGLLSDREWAELEAYRKALRISMTLSEEGRAMIESARARWRAHYGALRPVAVPGWLALGETACFRAPARWEIGDRVFEGELVLTDSRVLLLREGGGAESIAWGGLAKLSMRDAEGFVVLRGDAPACSVQVVGGAPATRGTATAIAHRLWGASMRPEC